MTVIENFYRRLYTTLIQTPDRMAKEKSQNILNVDFEDVPKIDMNELRPA